MKINRLAVFAASLQWSDAMKVVSRGTPKFRTSLTWGIWWSVSAEEKDGEREVSRFQKQHSYGRRYNCRSKHKKSGEHCARLRPMWVVHLMRLEVVDELVEVDG